MGGDLQLNPQIISPIAWEYLGVAQKSWKSWPWRLCPPVTRIISSRRYMNDRIIKIKFRVETFKLFILNLREQSIKMNVTQTPSLWF